MLLYLYKIIQYMFSIQFVRSTFYANFYFDDMKIVNCVLVCLLPCLLPGKSLKYIRVFNSA